VDQTLWTWFASKARPSPTHRGEIITIIIKAFIFPNMPKTHRICLRMISSSVAEILRSYLWGSRATRHLQLHNERYDFLKLTNQGKDSTNILYTDCNLLYSHNLPSQHYLVENWVLFYYQSDSPVGEINLYGFSPSMRLRCTQVRTGEEPLTNYIQIKLISSYRWSR
jgi:hypothetical protein